jgi:hypothetical protein
MRALVSPVDHARLAGIAQLIGVVPLLVLALRYERVPSAIFAMAVMTIFFGTWMFVIAYRGQARRGVLELLPAPAAPRQPRRATVGTIAVLTSIQTIIFLAFAAGARLLPWYADGPSFSLIGGIAAGQGLAWLLLSRWLRRWELEHDERLLCNSDQLRWPWRRTRPQAGTRAPFTYYGATVADAAPAEDVVYSP